MRFNLSFQLFEACGKALELAPVKAESRGRGSEVPRPRGCGVLLCALFVGYLDPWRDPLPSLPHNQLGWVHLEGVGELADGTRVRLVYSPGLELEYCGRAQTGSLGEFPLRQQTPVPNLPQPISTDARHDAQDCTEATAHRRTTIHQVRRKSSKVLRKSVECGMIGLQTRKRPRR